MAKISLDDKSFAKGVDGASKKGNDLNNSMSTAFSGIKKGVSLASGALAAGAVAATKYGMEFEAQMSKVGAISGATNTEMEQLTKKAKEMGIETKFSATEAGQAFEYMAMAGWKSGEMMNGISGIMNLAAASGEDLALTSDIVTDALTAFGLKARDSAMFADVLASASSNSNTNVAMMGETFRYVAPVAGSLGFSIKDTAVAIGLMANSGIKASMAGTSLRAGLTNLVKPTKKMDEAMSKYGISVTNSDGSMKSLNEIMVNLRQNLGKMDKATQAATVAQIFGKEAMSGWLAIINASEDDFAKLTNSIDKSEGSAEKMAETMNKNLKGQITLLKSSIESLGIAFYDKFKEPATKALEAIIPMLNKFVDLLSSGKIDWLLTLIANALGAVIIKMALMKAMAVGSMIIGIVASLGRAVSMVKSLNGVMAILNLTIKSNPIGLLLSLIAGLIVGFMHLWNTSDSFRNFWIGMWEGIKEAFNSAVEGISTFFNESLPNMIQSAKDWAINMKESFLGWIEDTKQGFIDWYNNVGESFSNFITETKDGIKNWAKDTYNSIKTWISDTWNGIKQWFSDTVTGFTNWAKEIPNKVSEMVNSIVDWFGELPYRMGYALGHTFTVIGLWFVNTWNYLSTKIPELIESIGEWFSQLPERIWEQLVHTWEVVKTWATNMVDTFLSWINETWTAFYEWGSNLLTTITQIGSDFLSAVWDWISQLPERIWDQLVHTFNLVVQWGSDMWAKAKEIGNNFLTAIIDWFKQLPSRIWQWLSDTASKVASWGRSLGAKAREIGSQFTTWLIDSVKSLPGKFLSLGGDIVRGVWEGITGMGSWIMGKVGDFFGGIVDGAKAALGIHSPSRVMRDEVGKWIPAGVGVGIEEGMPEVENIMSRSMGNLSNVAQTNVSTDGIGLANGSIGEQIIAKLDQLINKDVIITGEDGQELMRFLAPYQSELEEYSQDRNIKMAY